ncbi:hypothetical protein [Methanogenium cariaci]|jgi:hypothetical protein
MLKRYDEPDVHITDHQEMKPGFLNETGILSVSLLSTIVSLLFVTLLAGAIYTGPLMDTGSCVQHTVQINSRDIPLNDSEWNTYAEKTNAIQISEKISLLKQMMDESRSIGVPVFKGAWVDSIETASGHSDCLLLLYQSSQTDPVGRDHYYLCQWTVAEPDQSHQIRNMWSKVQLTDDESRLIIYTPGSTIVKTEPVSFFGSVTDPIFEHFNIRFWSDQDGYNPFMHQNTISPKTGECRVGYGGKYAVEWNGYSKNSEEVIGVMHIDVPAGQSLHAEWTNSLRMC